jgi:hypothetical protein
MRFSNCVGITLEGLNSNRNNKISRCIGANIALQSLQIDSALFRAVGLECLGIAGEGRYRRTTKISARLTSPQN